MMKENIPRWATATGVWLTVFLIGIIGWMLSEYKKGIEETIRELKVVTYDNKDRILLLEKHNLNDSEVLRTISRDISRLVIEVKNQNK